MATKSAAQRREERRDEYNAYLRQCPSRRVLDAISDKWVTLIVSALAGGSMRYSELEREIAGVSPKMLTQTLRGLERDGLVVRVVTAGVPPRVDYELTELGCSLRELVLQIKAWSELHIAEIEAARAAYDARS